MGQACALALTVWVCMYIKVFAMLLFWCKTIQLNIFLIYLRKYPPDLVSFIIIISGNTANGLTSLRSIVLSHQQIYCVS